MPLCKDASLNEIDEEILGEKIAKRVEKSWRGAGKRSSDLPLAWHEIFTMEY